MGQDFRSPSSGSAAAATTPARLAQEFEEVLWRELADGGLEVAVRREGMVDRLRVHDDGSTTRVASVPVRPHGWADALAAGGFFLALLAGGGMWLRGESSGTWAVVVAGVVMFAVGSVGSWRGADMRSQLGGTRAGWHEPTNLNGWSPRTAAQLAAVERIAEDHGGRALVRDVGAATIDVCAPRGCGLDRYLVDDGGAVDLTETPGVVQRLGAGVLVGLFVVAWLGIPPAAASRYGVVGMVSAIVVVLVGGVWLGNRLDPERRLRRGHDGAHWAEIVTRVPDSD